MKLARTIPFRQILPDDTGLISHEPLRIALIEDDVKFGRTFKTRLEKGLTDAGIVHDEVHSYTAFSQTTLDDLSVVKPHIIISDMGGIVPALGLDKHNPLAGFVVVVTLMSAGIAGDHCPIVLLTRLGNDPRVVGPLLSLGANGILLKEEIESISLKEFIPRLLATRDNYPFYTPSANYSMARWSANEDQPSRPLTLASSARAGSNESSEITLLVNDPKRLIQQVAMEAQGRWKTHLRHGSERLSVVVGRCSGNHISVAIASVELRVGSDLKISKIWSNRLVLLKNHTVREVAESEGVSETAINSGVSRLKERLANQRKLIRPDRWKTASFVDMALEQHESLHISEPRVLQFSKAG